MKISEFDIFEQRILKTIKEHNLIEAKDKILVAVSGGIDSTILLNALFNLKEYLNIEILSAHVNHNLRTNSKRDEEFVNSLCLKMGIVYYAKSLNIKSGTNLEQEGRKARYDFFTELKNRYGIDKIATAHNKNDQAETVLMRIFRGCGIKGLAGIKYKRQDGVIRPMLDLSRTEIEDYKARYNLKNIEDETNNNLEFTRNKIRHILIPELIKEYNPKILDSLSNLAKNSNIDSKFIWNYTKRLYKRLRVKSKEKISFHISSFNLIDNAIKSKLIKLAIEEVSGESTLELTTGHLENVINSLKKPKTGNKITISNKINIEIEYDWVVFYLNKVIVEKNFNYEIEFDKIYVFRELGIKISFSILDNVRIEEKNETLLNYDQLIGKKLIIRNPRFGDKITLNDGFRKKISRYFIDNKIPRKKRNKIPLLCTDNEILAIIGHRVSEKYKPEKSQNKILVILINDV